MLFSVPAMIVSMRPVDDGNGFAELLFDGGLHGFMIGTRHAYGAALADAGGEKNDLGAAINQHFRTDHCPFSGTAAAAHKADDFAWSVGFKGKGSGSGALEVRGSGAHVFRLLTADDAYFLHDLLLAAARRDAVRNDPTPEARSGASMKASLQNVS